MNSQGIMKFKNENQIIPLHKINPGEFKIDHLDYFNDNYKQNSKHPLKDDPMTYYSKKVLVNNNGVCNLILSQKKNEEIHNGWILLKKLISDEACWPDSSPSTRHALRYCVANGI